MNIGNAAYPGLNGAPGMRPGMRGNDGDGSALMKSFRPATDFELLFGPFPSSFHLYSRSLLAHKKELVQVGVLVGLAHIHGPEINRREHANGRDADSVRTTHATSFSVIMQLRNLSSSSTITTRSKDVLFE